MVPPFCHVVFPGGECELEWKESEILFFLLVVVMMKNRKTGNMSMLSYISSSFMYCKAANVLLYFSVDPRLMLVYVVTWILQFLLVVEPTYAGTENIVYFGAQDLEDEFDTDPDCVWLVCFYTAWNPLCVSFAPIFSKLSNKYALENLKFGKVDATRYNKIAKQHYVSDSSYGRQLPTVVMFKKSIEVRRRPQIDTDRKVHKFYFSEDNVIAAFDLNNLYDECKKNLSVKKKYRGDKSKTE